MEVINNRYKIIECSNIDSFYSKYTAIDLLNKNKKVVLYILKENQYSKPFINYCSHNFHEVSALNHKNLVTLYSFGTVETIDDKYINELLYFYTTEYFQPYLSEKIDGLLSREEVLQIYRQIAELLDFLHFHGIIYKYICLDNIAIYKEKNEIKVKLLDLVTIKKKEINKQYDQKHMVNCLSPEIFYGMEVGPYTDLYSLGVLLYYIYTDEDFNYNNLLSKINLRNVEKQIDWEVEFLNLILKATQLDYVERFQTVHQMNRAIVKLFQLQGTLENKYPIETLNFKIPIIGRDIELTKIMSLLENWDKNMILIHGDKGIGKTRFIKEIKYQMRFNKVRVFNISISSTKNNFYQMSTHLLKKVLRHAPKVVIDKYAEELVKLLPEIGLNKKITPSRELAEDREILRLYDRVANFIIEAAGNQSTLLALDDFHYADQTIIEFIDYFIKINRIKKSPIIVLLGYVEDQYYWKDTKKHLTYWKSTISSMEIKLTRLSVEETAKIIKHVFGWFKEPLKFATKLMKETEGNPYLTEELIKELYAQGLLYVNYSDRSDNFAWYSDFDDLSMVKLPENIDESIYTLLNTFDPFTRSLLEIIALFNTSVSLAIISKLLGEEDYSSFLNRLTQLKVLNEKLEDWGYTYGFYRNQLKTYIYESIPVKERILLHYKVSNILEELYNREGRENKEELIYHLIQSDQRDKAIDYSIEAGDNMFNLRIYSQATVFYKRAFSLLKEISDSRNIRLLMKIGEIYQNQGKNNEALDHYEKVLELTQQPDMEELNVDARCNIAQIYLNRNELEKAEDYLKNCLAKAEDIDYGEGTLKTAYLFARVYMYSKEVEKMEALCNKYLLVAKGLDRFEYIGMFLNLKGLVEFLNENIVQAKEYFETSVGFLEKGNKVEETGRPINNIGVILKDYFQKVKEAREYFEKSLKIAQQYHRMDDLFKAYNNIAECFMVECQYEKAIEVLYKNISLAIEYEDANIKLMGYSNLVECYVKIGDYKQAYNYLLKIESEVKELGYKVLYADANSNTMINFYMTVGDFNEALDYIYKLKQNPTTDIVILLRLRLSEFFAKTYSGEEVEEKELLDILKDHRDKKFTIERREALLLAVEYLYNEGKLDLADSLLGEDKTLIEVFNNHSLSLKRSYLEGIMLKDPTKKIQVLEGILGSLQSYNDKEQEWKIYSSLGYSYFMEGDFYKATNYYLSALEAIQTLVNRTPDKYKETYLIVENKYDLKQQLLKMERLIQQGIIQQIDFSTSKRTLKLADIDLQDFFDISRFQELFQNPAFYELALQQYKSLVSIEVNNIEELLQNLTSDVYHNLDLLMKLAGKNVLATTGVLLGAGEDGYEIVASLGPKFNIEKINHLLEKTASNKNGLLFINHFKHVGEGLRDYINKETRASICIPIIQNEGSDQNISEERRSWRLKDKFKICGYLYLETDKVFNNFSYETFKECKKLIPLANIMLNNYYLKIESSIDKMTGTYARKYFEKLLVENLKIAQEMKQNLSVIMCDIDLFKSVNDTYGHQRGDMVLEKVGKVIKNNIRATDYVGRYGGEEFIIILPGVDKNYTFNIAEKIRISFKNENLLGEEVDLTLSCGVSSFPEDGETKELIVGKADQALYIAKENGRNQTIIWRDGLGFVDKRVDKLAGIVTGNIVQDQRSVLVLAEAIEILTEKRAVEEKIFILLGRLIEILEAEEGILFLVNNTEILTEFCRKRFVDNWIYNLHYNQKLIEKVIQSKQGEYLIDWEDISQIDIFTGTPNWKSVIVVPIILNGDLKGVIYLSASVKQREFDFNAYNLAKITSSIMGPFVEQANLNL